MNEQELRQAALDHEPDRVVSASFAPRQKRFGLLLIIVIDRELARIKTRAHEPQLRSISFQFWREAFAAPSNSAHPLVISADDHFRQNAAMLRGFAALVDAHEDLAADALSTARHMVAVNGREARLFELGCTWLSNATDKETEQFFDACGTSYGTLRYLCSRGDRQQIEPGGVTSLLSDVELANTKIKPALERLPSAARSALLPLALVPSYLRLLKNPDKTLSQQPLTLSPLTRLVRLWRAATFGF